MKTKRTDFGKDKFIKTFKAFRHGGSVQIGWTDQVQASKIAYNHERWPVVTSTYKSMRQEIIKATRNDLRRIRKGEISTKQVYKDLGELIAARLRMTIFSISAPRNAQATIDKKGFDMPLVDSGELVNSIEVIIND